MTDYTNPPLRPVCEVPQDGIVVLYPGVSAKYEDCEFPEGTTFRAYYSTQGLEMDTDTQQPKTQELQVEPPAVPAIDPAQLQQLGAENPMLAIALAARAASIGSGQRADCATASVSGRRRSDSGEDRRDRGATGEGGTGGGQYRRPA